jgi:putative aldouronate transport system permease protein
VGWGSVIYLAAIAGIDQELYEAARIDGANRLQQAWRVTIPLLTPVMAVLLILSIGGILNAGFDQIFNLYSAMVYKVSDILDTYIYRRGLIESDYSFATAAGLFKNVIGFFLVIGSNFFSRRVSEYGVW